MKTTVQAIKTRLAKMRSEISTVGSPNRAARLVADCQSFISSTKPLVAQLKNQVRTEYALDLARHTGVIPSDNVAPTDTTRETSRILRTAAGAVAVLDLLCGGLMGAIFLNFDTLTAVAIGVLLSLVISSVAAAAWQGILVTDPEAPGKSIHVLRGQLKVFVPLYVGCLVGALLIGRVASSWTTAGAVMFAVSLTCLAVLGPMVLAVLLRLAGILSWAHKHAVAFKELSNLELELDELQQTCATMAVAYPVDQTLEKRRLAIAGTTVAALLLCCGANAYAASECASVWLDSSLSTAASSERHRTALSAFALVPEWAASTRCRSWAFYAFGGRSFTDAPFITVQFPELPTGTCPVRKAARTDLSVFKGPAEADEQTWQKKCEEYQLNEVRIYQRAIETRISEVAEKLAAYRPVDPERTCIVDLLQRVRDSDTTRFAMVITDGTETCLPYFRGPIPAPLALKPVVMVIISPGKMRNSSSPGTFFSGRRDIWMTLAPWLSAVIPASNISHNTFGPLPNPAKSPVAGGSESKQH